RWRMLRTGWFRRRRAWARNRIRTTPPRRSPWPKSSRVSPRYDNAPPRCGEQDAPPPGGEQDLGVGNDIQRGVGKTESRHTMAALADGRHTHDGDPAERDHRVAAQLLRDGPDDGRRADSRQTVRGLGD